MNGKERVLAMLDGKPVDHLPLMPITMMFAADLAGVPYRDYAADHRVLAEAQMRVAEAFGFDHVSAISDPRARPPTWAGPWSGSTTSRPPSSRAGPSWRTSPGSKTLKLPDMTAPGRMRDRIEAVALLKQKTGGSRIVEGWVEGPCAMAADLRGLNTLMLDFHDDPDFVDELFEFVVAMEVAFARAQVEAGADLIGVGDAAASLIGPKLVRAVRAPLREEAGRRDQGDGGRVRLHICGNTRKILRGMGTLGCDIVDLDFLSPMAEGRAAMGPDQVLLGNIDPVRVLRDGTPGEHHRDARGVLPGRRPAVHRGGWLRGAARARRAENLRALTDFARSHQP